MSSTVEAEARPKHAEILGLQSNRVGDGGFPPSSLTVEPEDWWCRWVCVIHPVKDLVQDLGSCAIETLLSFDQPDLACANQGVQAKVFSDLLDTHTKVFPDLLDTPLDVEECPISKTLHQLI